MNRVALLVVLVFLSGRADAAYQLFWWTCGTNPSFCNLYDCSHPPEPMGDFDGDGQYELVNVSGTWQQPPVRVEIRDVMTGQLEGEFTLGCIYDASYIVFPFDLNNDQTPEIIVAGTTAGVFAAIGSVGATAVPGVPGVQESITRFRPNPFNPSATIDYSVPYKGTARLQVYDASGRLVRTLVDGKVEPGTQSVAWDGRDDTGQILPSGTYFYSLSLDSHVLGKGKAVILK